MRLSEFLVCALFACHPVIDGLTRTSPDDMEEEERAPSRRRASQQDRNVGTMPDDDLGGMSMPGDAVVDSEEDEDEARDEDQMEVEDGLDDFGDESEMSQQPAPPPRAVRYKAKI